MGENRMLRTGLIIVIFGLVATLAYLGINLLALWSPADRPGSVDLAAAQPGLLTSQTPLQDAATQAQQRAKAWSDDAVLVRAEGSWIAPRDWRQVARPPVAWSFTFYSPSNRELASVAVTDETTLWVPPRAVPIVPAPLVGFPPRFGVDTAWLSFRGAGGDGLLEAYPEAQLRFVLQPRSGEPVWTVSARHEGVLVQVTVDAQTGAVTMQ